MAQCEVDLLPKSNLARLLQIGRDSYTNPHTLVQSERVAHVRNKCAFYSKHIFNLYFIVFTIARMPSCIRMYLIWISWIFVRQTQAQCFGLTSFTFSILPFWFLQHCECGGFEQAANRFNSISLVNSQPPERNWPKRKGVCFAFRVKSSWCIMIWARF